MQQRFAELREIESQPVDRRRDEQIEVFGEEEARERRNDVREQDQAEDFSRDQRPQLLDRTQRLQDLVQDAKDAEPERPRDDRQNDELPGAAAGALFAQPLQRGPPFGLEHMRERRLLHRPSTSTSSRTWAPPVSFRKSSSRLASPAWCWRRTSLTVPAATVLPCWMIAI